MQSSFSGKTVVITGASAGVGAACAQAFANAGAKLVLIARGETALQALAEQLRHQTEVLTVAMDVADQAAGEAMLHQAEQRFGAVHVLINNAGMHTRGPVSSLQPDQVASMVDVNLRAPLALSCATIPYLRKAGGGAIVMVGSLAGKAPLQGAATYSATKAGLRAFSHALAEELVGQNIHVGVVSPGPIDTGFIMGEIDQVEDIVFSQAMSSAEQVADAIMALAKGEKTEISMPTFGGKLVHLNYLFPRFRRAIRPLLYRKGAKNKAKYRRQSHH